MTESMHHKEWTRLVDDLSKLDITESQKIEVLEMLAVSYNEGYSKGLADYYKVMSKFIEPIPC